MDSNIFVRIVLAVIFAIALLAVVPAVFRLVGFPLSADLELIIRVAIALSALYYIVRGRTSPLP
jgi:hypothetical protein